MQSPPFPRYLVTLGPNILLNTMFSNTLSFLSSRNVKDQVSHPYKTTRKIILLLLLVHIIICTNNNNKIISSNYGRLEDLILPSKVPKGTRKCSSKLFNNLGTGPQRFSSPGPGQPFNQETASILLRRHLFLPVGTPEGISAAGLKDVEAEDVGEKEYKMFQQRTIDVKESATDSCGERWFSN